MLELSVSVQGSTGMLAVGVTEPGAPLPREVRVLDYDLGELVAAGVATHLADTPATAPDLDDLVAHARRVLARRRTPTRRLTDRW